MSGQGDGKGPGGWGHIVVESGHDLQGLPAELYTWVPPGSLAGELPNGFFLALKCVTDTDGIRRFFPAEHPDDFLARAWAGGLAVLSRAKKLTPDQLFTY